MLVLKSVDRIVDVLDLFSVLFPPLSTGGSEALAVVDLDVRCAVNFVVIDEMGDL